MRGTVIVIACCSAHFETAANISSKVFSALSLRVFISFLVSSAMLTASMRSRFFCCRALQRQILWLKIFLRVNKETINCVSRTACSSWWEWEEVSASAHSLISSNELITAGKSPTKAATESCLSIHHSQFIRQRTIVSMMDTSCLLFCSIRR